MAMFNRGDERTLSGLRSMILPGVFAVGERAKREGVPIKDADLQIDFLYDELQLCVRHTLLTRHDIEGRSDRDWKSEVGHRIDRAMRLFHRMPAAKALCVDRRRLNARGEKARKEANRPVRKSAKRRFA